MPRPRESNLLLLIGIMMLALLATSLSFSILRGIQPDEWPFLWIGVAELTIPSLACLTAAAQLRTTGKRWLAIVALVLCAPFAIGMFIAPFLMVKSTGTARAYLVSAGALVFAIIQMAAYLRAVYLLSRPPQPTPHHAT